MSKPTEVMDKEIKAMMDIHAILQPMDEEQRVRLLACVAIMLGLVSSDHCTDLVAEATGTRRYR